jgi:hypothetical protein
MLSLSELNLLPITTDKKLRLSTDKEPPQRFQRTAYLEPLGENMGGCIEPDLVDYA